MSKQTQGDGAMTRAALIRSKAYYVPTEAMKHELFVAVCHQRNKLAQRREIRRVMASMLNARGTK